MQKVVIAFLAKYSMNEILIVTLCYKRNIDCISNSIWNLFKIDFLLLEAFFSNNGIPQLNVDLLKIVPVEILINFGNYFRTLQFGF